jgi:hypothetical protein
MQPDRPTAVEEPLDDKRRRTTLRVCDQFQQGIITAEEAREKFLFCNCVEPLRVAEYVKLLPEDLRAALPAVLATTPKSDEEWANFDKCGQFDGSDRTWAAFILGCRVGTEAIRACVLGETSPAVASDFEDRVRAVYWSRINRSAYEQNSRAQL